MAWLSGLLTAVLGRLMADWVAKYLAKRSWTYRKDSASLLLLSIAVLMLPKSERERYEGEWFNFIIEQTADERLSQAAGLLLAALGIRQNVTVGSARFGTKRALDVVGSALAIFLVGPLLMACVLAIKLTSPGPVLFRQTRVGHQGRLFNLYKFRTTSTQESRLTSVGLFLRRSSIDELPQLWNVLLGDMSLVGPRAYPPDMRVDGKRYDDLPEFARRHRMRPGITGWAQANGLRGPTHDENAANVRLEHDLYYVKNFSLWFDVRIIFLTLWAELAPRHDATFVPRRVKSILKKAETVLSRLLGRPH